MGQRLQKNISTPSERRIGGTAPQIQGDVGGICKVMNVLEPVGGARGEGRSGWQLDEGRRLRRRGKGEEMVAAGREKERLEGELYRR